MRPPRVDDARCARCSAQFSDRSSERAMLDSAVKIGILFRGTVSHAPLWRFRGRGRMIGGILFDNRYDSRTRHLRPHFQLRAAPESLGWKFLTSPATGIFRLNWRWILSREYFLHWLTSISTGTYLYARKDCELFRSLLDASSTPVPSSPLRFVFSYKFSTYREDIFVPWKACYEIVAHLGRKKKKERKEELRKTRGSSSISTVRYYISRFLGRTSTEKEKKTHQQIFRLRDPLCLSLSIYIHIYIYVPIRWAVGE